MKSKIILWLSEAECQRPEKVGNKGATLAKLVAGGYAVPPGFCVTTDAMTLVAQAPTEADKSFLVTGLQQSLQQLPRPWVVRSSSTAEDAKNLSFAGVFKTVLGLTSVESVFEAIRRVVSSKNLETAQRYALHHGVNPGEIRMAVIVQTLVNPSCAGVAFSRHPVTNVKKVVIESTYGLGDILVGGAIIPDLLEVTEDGRVEVVRIGTKKIKSIFVSDKLIEVDTSESDRKNSSLPQERARNLAILVRKIEADFGHPQDVEWALTVDQFFILQARPITTIKA